MKDKHAAVASQAVETPPLRPCTTPRPRACSPTTRPLFWMLRVLPGHDHVLHMVIPPEDDPPLPGCVLWLPTMDSPGETSKKMARSFSFISFTKLAAWAGRELVPAPGSDLGQAFIPGCQAWAQEGLVPRELSRVCTGSCGRLLHQVRQGAAPREGCYRLGVEASIQEPI